MPVIGRLFLAATSHKNTTRRHNKAFSFELSYNCVSKLFPICNPAHRDSAEGNVVDARLRASQSGLHASIRTSPSIRVGEEVSFWHGNRGWTGPGTVTDRKENLIEIAKKKRIVKSADIHRAKTNHTMR